jgi:hypothetical protein
MLRSGLFSSMDSPLSGDHAEKKSLLKTLKAPVGNGVRKANRKRFALVEIGD